MPAILPARLKQQAALLAEHFDDPAAFVRSLHHLLDSYAERVHRPGQAGSPPPLLTAYKVRPQVLRQVSQELVPLAKANPEAGLALCDALWEQSIFEFRLLAASLLGQIPCTPPEPILKRIQTWIQPDVETLFVEALFSQGIRCLRCEHPGDVINLAGGWLHEKDLFHQQLGLRVLLSFINDSQYENLPAFFRLVQPIVRAAPARLRPDILEVLVALIRRSPSETAYFLRQTADLPNSPDTPFLIRQLVHDFPVEMQPGLREFSRQRNERTRKME